MSNNENEPVHFNIEVDYGPRPADKERQEGEVEVAIPFCGLYESIINDMCYRHAEYEEEWVAERYEEADDEEKKEIAEEYKQKLMYLDMEDTYNQWIDMIERIVRETTGISVPMRLAGCWSPREYNFYSDQLTVFIKEEHLRQLFNWVQAHEQYKSSLEERVEHATTSRDGYIPYYDKEDFDGWPTSMQPCQHQLLFDTIVYLGIDGGLGNLEIEFYDSWEPKVTDEDLFKQKEAPEQAT